MTRLATRDQRRETEKLKGSDPLQGEQQKGSDPSVRSRC